MAHRSRLRTRRLTSVIEICASGVMVEGARLGTMTKEQQYPVNSKSLTICFLGCKAESIAIPRGAGFPP